MEIGRGLETEEREKDAGMGVDAVAMAEGVLLGGEEEGHDDEVGGEEGGEEWEEEAAAVSGETPLLFYGVQVR